MDFKPEYFSGLNRNEAEPLIGKLVEVSNSGREWAVPRKLEAIVMASIYQFITITKATVYI